MTETIRTANLNQDTIVVLRDIYHDNRANSLNIEQTSGGFVISYPFASNTQLNNVTIYPPSSQLDINTPIIMTGFDQIGNLSLPSDARYDYVRRKIWIADTGNHRILKINEDTQVVDGLIRGDELYPNKLLYPYAIAVNLNNGGIFVRGYTGENAEFDAVFYFNSDTSLQAKFILTIPVVDNSSSSSSIDSESSSSMESRSSSSTTSYTPIPGIKTPYSITYDHVRSRAWWVNDTKVYMADEKNQQVEVYDLGNNGFVDLISVDVELSTGNPLIVAISQLSEYKLVEMNRDNTKFLASAYVPLTTPSINSSSSSSSESSGSEVPVPVLARHIKVPIINQKHHNLIPITWIGEAGTPKDLGNASLIGFMVESSNSAYMDYTAIINRDNSALTNGSSAVSTTYVPETEEARYKHQSTFYVDVITKDNSGVKKVRTHVEPNKYEFEEPDNVFIVPRFSWDNTLRGASNAASLSYDGTFWVGSENGNLSKIGYGNNSGSILHTIDVSSYIGNVMFAYGNNRMYASTDSSLSLYYVENYVDRDEVSFIYSNVNSERTSMVLYDSNVWSTQTYFGNVVILEKDTMVEIKRYTGLDGPFKIVKSEFHQGNIVAGAHILWLIEGDVKTAIYEVNDYRITDFDVSPDGKICLLLDGDSYDVIRILERDGYKFIWNQKIETETLRYCKYIDAGKFFIFSEISTTGTPYSAFTYIFDTNKKTLIRSG